MLRPVLYRCYNRKTKQGGGGGGFLAPGRIFSPSAIDYLAGVALTWTPGR